MVNTGIFLSTTCALALGELNSGCGGATAGGAAAGGATADAAADDSSPDHSEGNLPALGLGLEPAIGMMCPRATEQTAAIRIDANVTWAPTVAFPGGAGRYSIWLLSHYKVDAAGHIVATIATCQITPPPWSITTEDAANNAPTSTTMLGVESPVSECMKITKTVTAMGTLGGWSVGSSVRIDPAVLLLGLKDTSPYENPATPWPQPSVADPFGNAPDYEAEEGDGTPGITFLPMAGAGYGEITPGTSAVAPDRIFLATRTELSLFGKTTSCTQTNGIATVTRLDHRVIGCSLGEDGGLCTSDQATYIDDYVFPVFVPGQATFKQVLLPAGAAATCDDVITGLVIAGE